MSKKKELDRAALVPLVCERLSTGKESLTTICRDLGFERRTFNKWRKEDPEIDAQAQLARQEWCESLEEDLLEIADDSANDNKDVDSVARSKLRFYARERLLKAYHPSRWSEKQQIDHSSSDGSMTPRGLGDFYAGIAIETDSANS